MKQLATWFLSTFIVISTAAQEHGIINNADSPHVRLKSIDIGDCQWTEGFWADKFQLCQDVMVPHMGTLLKGDIGHAYNNFKIVAGLKKGKHQGTNWHDGDFYKWMESAVYVYGINQDPAILNELDEIIAVIEKAQGEDGYLHTRNMIEGNERYSNRGHHELYNSGHLLTSACIHYRVTGKRNFLDIAIKNADHLYEVFQPRPAKLARFGHNPTNITGLVELYRTTKDARYLELAGIFVDMRGNDKSKGNDAVSARTKGDFAQDRTPLRKEDEAVGHAVLGMYLYAGAADVYAETGEKELLDALDRIWSNVVDKKMYLTGAIGQAHHGASSNVDLIHEGFIDEYMMPNATAYNETCANVCNAMFNWRMLGIKGESRFADIMEQVLYNSALAGISEDGRHYFYTNPLRRTFDQHMDTTDYETRTPYIPCFCCPPNLVRTIAKLSGWAYSLSENGVAVNLYGGNKLNTELLDGSKLQLVQETQYPWNGDVKITIQASKKAPFEMRLRIPGWANGSKVLVNGKNAGVESTPGTYASIKRKWKKGDVVTLKMPMPIQLIEGHPRIEETRNQVAIKRGPVVYCIETPDLPENTSILDVYFPESSELKVIYRPDLMGGLSTISGNVSLRSSSGDSMYRTLSKSDWKSVQTSFVPYYAWSNRGKSEMTVFMPIKWK